jgi:hypothetical protein
VAQEGGIAVDPIRKKVLLLLKLTGTEEDAARHFREAHEAFGKMGVSKKGLSQLKKIANPEQLVERLAPIWEEHYSEEEIDALISWYSSPIGKKFLQTQKESAPKVMGVMKKWLEEVFEHVFEEVE